MLLELGSLYGRNAQVLSNLIVMQVGTNGYFSFGKRVATCCPSPFPNTLNYLVAPFWADIDISRDDGGEIYYQVHSRGNNSVSDELLHEVSAFISNNQQTVFNGSWMLVATWDQVKAFSGDPFNVSLLTHSDWLSYSYKFYEITL